MNWKGGLVSGMVVAALYVSAMLWLMDVVNKGL